MNIKSNTATESATVVTPSRILGLALPALGVLVATPLFILLDTAVVGRSAGAASLAALAAASTIYAQVTGQLTFLSYGTTARAARSFGAGKRSQAVAQGVQATWIAVVVGFSLTIIVWCGAGVFTGLLTSDPQVSAQATQWLKITSFAIPLVLIDMAGNGWLRGVQNTRLPLLFTLAGVIPAAIFIPLFVHWWGLVGSGWATLLATAITAVLFLTVLVKQHEGSWAPQWREMKAQLVLGRDLILRSLAFQVSFIGAAAVAGRMGSEVLAAHQVLLQLWNFIAMVLDSLAIAAQALIGAALGAGSAATAFQAGKKILGYSTGFAVVLAVGIGLGHDVLPRIFSTDTQVLAAIDKPWWQLVVLIVIGGVVFSLDGVLLGAADAAFLRTLTLVAAVCGFLPGLVIAWVTHTGLIGVWWGLIVFMLIRLTGVVHRFMSRKWARVAEAGIE